MSEVGRFPGLIARRPVRGSPTCALLDDERSTSEFVCTSGEIGLKAFENSDIELGSSREIDSTVIVRVRTRRMGDNH